jgi:hypothetical protein
MYGMACFGLTVVWLAEDGTVSREEWEHALGVADVKLSPEDNAAIWELVDTDGSGTIDIEEMRVFVHGGPMAGDPSGEGPFERQKEYVLSSIIPSLYFFFSRCTTWRLRQSCVDRSLLEGTTVQSLRRRSWRTM